MGYTLNLVLSYSILFPFVAGIIRYRQLWEGYLPILIWLVLGVANEITSTIVINAGGSNALNTTIYYLAEALLLLYQFAKWGLFGERKFMYFGLISLLIATWITEHRSIESFHLFLPYFRILTAVTVVAMSLRWIFVLMVFNRKEIGREPSFLFCFGFCCYFLSVIVTEIFISNGSPFSNVFQDLLFRTSAVCNVISNVIYLTAILWIPMKRYFISA